MIIENYSAVVSLISLMLPIREALCGRAFNLDA